MNKFILTTICFCGLAFAQLGLAQSVGIKYDINATNPAAVIAAMDKFSATPTGQAGPGTVTLFQYIVNGESPATHNFVVNYPSLEDMDASLARNAMSQDWATFLEELSAVSEQVHTMMFRSTGITSGDSSSITSPTSAGNWIFMNVQDPATYVDAWQDLNSNDSLQGTNTLLEIIADGTDGITHAIIQSANNMASLLATPPPQLPGWSRFIDRVGDIRTIENRTIVVRVKSWTAQ
jgi:hypothetical protein